MNALTAETAKLQHLVDEVTMSATGCINSALGITLAMQRVIELVEATTHRTMKELSKEVNVIALNLAIDAVKLNEQAEKLTGMTRQLGLLARTPV